MKINPEEFGEAFNNEKFKEIYQMTSDDFQQLVSMEEFVQMSKAFNEGVEQYHLENRTAWADLDHHVWLDDKNERAINAAFDENQQIQSLLLKPYVTYPESDNKFTQNEYIMPIKGEWFVFWGGTNEFINYHYTYENQRYAYDLEKVQDGLSYKSSHDVNENYYAFGEEIIAPAAGRVVEVIEGIEDNVPGEMDPYQPAGNYVIIEHRNGEYSMLAHLKKGSIEVREGEEVKMGQRIGKCGNSGNSSQPHLHFQITDSKDWENGNSIRIRFMDGNEPIQGDFISNN